MHVAWSYCQAAVLVPNGKQMNWSNFKKKSLLVHKDNKIKITEMFNECCYLCKLEV